MQDEIETHGGNMARGKKKAELTLEEKLKQALVPVEEQPYEVPGNWCWVKLNSVSEIYTGNSINEKIKRERYLHQPDGLNFIATKDIGFDNSIVYDNGVKINDYDRFKVAPENTSLLCVEGGSAGRKLGFTKEKVCFGNKLCAFVSKGCVPKYVFYYLQSNVFYAQFVNQRHGLIGGVSVKDLSSFFMPIATIEEQKRIVEQIENLFAKLDEAKEKAQFARNCSDANFVSTVHEALAGNLTEEWRKKNGISINGWKKNKLGNLGSLERGRSKHRPRNDPRLFGGSYPFIQTGDVAEADVYIENHKQTLSEFGLAQSRMFPKGTLCITIAANIGDVAILSYDCCFPDSVVGFTPNKDVESKYIYYMMRELQKEIEANAPATAQKNINLKILNDIDIIIPSVIEQREIIEILDHLYDKKKRAEEKVEQVVGTIDMMKKSILAKAFRGELGTNNLGEKSSVELLKLILKHENIK